MNNDTIAAIASGPSPGAIGVLRISGAHSLEIICACQENPRKFIARRMYLSKLIDPDSKRVLDEVLIAYFRAPHSYTGEDTVEIYAHGGSLNLARILETILKLGARLAQPGEFTQRAFLNKKLDLSQAEAVMDIIGAQTQRALDEAQRQLTGSLSKYISELRHQLLKLLILIEASIDFSAEEELAPFPYEELEEKSTYIIDQIERMIRAHQSLRMNGYRVVLLGRPNAGKSSLFNLMLGRDRAIVTDISGTTTDTIEERVNLHSYPLVLIDTAGIAATDNVIEQLGVERSLLEARQADIVVWLIDASEDFISIDPEIADVLREYIEKNRAIIVFNKIDLAPDWSHSFERAKELIFKTFEYSDKENVFGISTKSRIGVAQFENAIADTIRAWESEYENTTLITSQRHITLLEDARTALIRAKLGTEQSVPAECLASDIHDAANSLAQITGAIASDEILNAIFSQFCIGK